MPVIVDGSSSRSTMSSSHSSQQKMTVIRDGASSMSLRMDQNSSSSEQVDSVGALLDYIGRERLRRMPHPGSKWDKIYQWAAYFASQLELFCKTSDFFLSQSQEASGIICSSCHRLLELGPSQTQILEQIFAVFYNIGSTLAFLHSKSEFFVSVTEVHQVLAYTFSDILSLVTDITAQYGRSGGASSKTTSTTSFSHIFGSRITEINSRMDVVANGLWTYAIQHHASEISSTVSIQTIRSFLWCSDSVMRAMSTNSTGMSVSRAEFTCEWFKKPLTQFTRSDDKQFVVAGKPGSGKSTLFAWVVERLQRAEGSNLSNVISFAIDSDMKSQTSVVAVTKGLLLQLLDINIGNITFYNLICSAYNTVATAKSDSEIEQALFTALVSGLKDSPDLMIVIDGLDELSGGDTTGIKLLELLHQLSEKNSRIKSVVFSQPLTKNVPHKTRSLTLEPSHVQHDIRHCVQEAMTSTTQFRHMKSEEKEKVVSRISESAEGSFVWALISLELLKREKTLQGMIQAVDSLPKSLNESLKKLVSLIDIKASDTTSLLAWLLAAERPLTLSEIKVFFEIDLRNCSRKPRFTDTEHDVQQAVGPLITIVNGAVRFRHHIIRSYLVQLAASVKDYSNTGDFPFMIKEAHYDLSARCLAYTKIFVTSQVEVSFEPLQEPVLNDLFTQQVCFEYSSTYWLTHFTQSPMYDPNGKHKLVPEFRNCFPNSVLLPLVESTTWGTSYSPTDYELVLYLRQTIVGKQAPCTLQTLITVAKVYERLTNWTKASTYYYETYELIQNLYGEEHDLIDHCVTSYLSTSSTITVTEKDETFVRRETMLKRIIATYKRTKGTTHDITVRYLNMLVQLYTDTKQIDLASTVYEELYAVYIEKYGRTSTETTTMYKTMIETLEKSSRREEINKYIATSEKRQDTVVAVSDEQSVKSTRDMVKYYETKGDTSKAESVLVDRWRSLSETASTSNDTTIEKHKVDATLQYVDFLKRHKRTSEAHTILDGLWTEYQSKQVNSDASASAVMQIAKEMKQFSSTTARSIYQSAYGYFKTNQKVTSTEASEAVSQIQEITHEIVETSSTTTSRDMSETSNSSKNVMDESTLLEILDSTISSLTVARSTKALSSVIKSALQLATLYALQARWSECYSVCSQTLTTLWPYVVTLKGQVALPAEFRIEAITLATLMGDCLFHQHQIERAEDVYVHIYTATKATLKLTDEMVSKTLQVVLNFYEQTFSYKRWVKIHSEFYGDLKTHLGPSHNLTVRVAYRLAEFCERFHMPDAEHFWYEIYAALSKGEVTQVEAITAAQHLLLIYDRDARWEPAEKLCASIWKTITTRGAELRVSTDFVEQVYGVYAHILTDVKKSSSEDLYKLTVAYKEACTKIFGARNELTLKATVQLAQVCERSEQHRSEAVSIYEEAVKHTSGSSTSTSSTVTTQTITRAKQYLARAYAQQSTTSTKATATSTELFQSAQSQYGWTDERTLSSVSELVSINAKSNSQESIQQSTQILQSAMVETILHERKSETLIKRAQTFAKSYVEVNRKDTAVELIQEIRRQLITADYTSKKFNVSMKGTDRRSYVFVIAFEQALGIVPKTASFSELMAELTTEILLYQSYNESVRTKASFDVVIEQGSKLLDFYQNRKRTTEYERTFAELMGQFATALGVSKSSALLSSFFELCLKEIRSTTYHTTVIRTVAGWILAKTKEHKHSEAFELAQYVQKFVRFYGGWYSQEHVDAGFEICLYLVGRHGAVKCGDAKLYQSLLELSSSILKEVLVSAKDLDILFIQMRVDLINSIVSILSEQQNFIELEWILSSLWHSRHVQTSWSSDTIVNIGRRLVEVRFAINRRDEATHLCRDIIYNLKRVWGPFDRTTQDMVLLLSELYTAAGEHNSAIQVHTDQLETILVAVDEGDLATSRAASIAHSEMDLLKKSYVRNGGWGKDKSASSYKDLFEQLSTALAKESSFAKGLQSIDKWSTKEKIDDKDVWSRPSSFEFHYDESAAGESKHKNNLRKTMALEPPTSPRRPGAGHSSTTTTYTVTSSSSNVKSNGHSNGQ